MIDRAKLYWALRSRVLTDEEMAEVERVDLDLIIEPGVSFIIETSGPDFNAALLPQFKLRNAAS